MHFSRSIILRPGRTVAQLDDFWESTSSGRKPRFPANSPLAQVGLFLTMSRADRKSSQVTEHEGVLLVQRST